MFQASGPKEQAGATVLWSDKTDYKPKLGRKDNEGYLIPVKGTIHQEDIKILNMYGPNADVPNFIKLLQDLK